MKLSNIIIDEENICFFKSGDVPKDENLLKKKNVQKTF